MTDSNNWAVRFFTLWTGQALSLLGSQWVQFAIIWHLTTTTHSATTLAIAGCTRALMGLAAFLIPDVMEIENRSKEESLHVAAESS